MKVVNKNQTMMKSWIMRVNLKCKPKFPQISTLLKSQINSLMIKSINVSTVKEEDFVRSARVKVNSHKDQGL